MRTDGWTCGETDRRTDGYDEGNCRDSSSSYKIGQKYWDTLYEELSAFQGCRPH